VRSYRTVPGTVRAMLYRKVDRDKLYEETESRSRCASAGRPAGLQFQHPLSARAGHPETESHSHTHYESIGERAVYRYVDYVPGTGIVQVRIVSTYLVRMHARRICDS
jgi:hypothetical protein